MYSIIFLYMTVKKFSCSLKINNSFIIIKKQY